MVIISKQKKFILILILWAVILNFSFPAGANDDNKKAKLSYEKALEVYSEEDFPGALRLLDRIITDYPRISYGKKAAYLARIIIQYKLSLKELRELSGKNGLVQGIVYQREGKEDKAFAEFQAVLLNPALERWRLWAKEMIQSSKWNRNIWEKDRRLAVKMYEIMLEMGDNSAAQKLQMENRLIRLYKEAGMIKERAIEKEDTLAITDKKLLEAYKKTAQSYEKKKDYKKAVRMYRKALVLSPQDEYLKKLLERVEKLINKTGR